MTQRLFGAGLLSVVIALAAGRSAADDDKKDDKPFTDAGFVMKAGHGGLFDLKASELAQTKAANDFVKKFADRMVKDHTKVNEELATIAKGIPAEVPTMMDEKHQKIYDQLNAQSGAAFDKAFMDAQVKAHEKSVELYKKATTEARNAELKAFATKTLPIIEEHLKMAKDIQRQVSN